MSLSVEEIMAWSNVANWAEAEMIQGFMDGYDLDSLPPSMNRSRSYRHGFANAKDDLAKKPRAAAEDLRKIADAAIAADLQSAVYCG